MRYNRTVNLVEFFVVTDQVVIGGVGRRREVSDREEHGGRQPVANCLTRARLHGDIDVGGVGEEVQAEDPPGEFDLPDVDDPAAVVGDLDGDVDRLAGLKAYRDRGSIRASSSRSVAPDLVIAR